MSQNTVREVPTPPCIEAECWKMRLRGMTPEAIAQACGQSREWVDKVLDRLLLDLEHRPQYPPRSYIEKLIDELDIVRQSAWAGWERSREDHIRFTDKFTSCDTPGEKKDVTTVRDLQVGDIAFLRLIADCNKREGSLRGIEKAGQTLVQAVVTGGASVDEMMLQADAGTPGENGILWELGQQIEEVPA